MRKKYLIQHKQKDCGAACLAMIASFHNIKISTSRCAQLTNTDSNGCNIYGILSGAKEIGLTGTALSGDINELFSELDSEKICFPFIAHIISDDNLLHFVVVYGYNKKKQMWDIADPGIGKRSLSNSEFVNCWTGNIVVFFVTENDKSQNYRYSSINYAKLIVNQLPRISIVILLSLLIAGIGISSALGLEYAIDRYIYSEYAAASTVDVSQESPISSDEIHDEEDDHSEDSTSTLVTIIENIIIQKGLSSCQVLALFFSVLIILYIISAILQLIRGVVILFISKNFDIHLTLNFHNHILDLPFNQSSMNKTGEYLARFTDASLIREGITNVVLSVILNTAILILGCFELYHQCSKLFFMALVIYLLYALVCLLFVSPIEKTNRKMMENNADVQSDFKESIAGLLTIKTWNMENKIKDSFSCSFNKYLNSIIKSSSIELAQGFLKDSITAIGTILILWSGVAMILNNQLTIGNLIGFYMMLSFFTDPVESLLDLQPSIQSAYVAADRLNDITGIPPEKENTNPQNIGSFNELSFVNVSFRYRNNDLCLHNVSLKVHRNQKVGIIGSSGSGKSSLTKLIFKLYPIESGNININGVDLDDYNTESIRKLFAYIPQNNFFFADSIRNNLCLKNNCSDEKILDMCNKCNIVDFINALPLGLDTTLEENGENLSLGERQRLALVRTLLSDATVLVIDELTNGLDYENEFIINNTIFNLDKTVIMVTHSIETMRQCDYLYYLEDGQITHEGTFDYLCQIGICDNNHM